MDVPSGWVSFLGTSTTLGRGLAPGPPSRVERNGYRRNTTLATASLDCGFHRFSPPGFTRIRQPNSPELAARFTGFGRAFHA